MRRILVATRNPDKLREIRQILRDPDVELIDLATAGVEERPEEEEIECYDTFAENALAKARYFAAGTELPVLADDSGLCVDALNGAPGVRSKRFSGRTDLRGPELDRANNERLLRSLAAVPREERTGRYVCAVAIVGPDGGERVFEGTCEGEILEAPKGSGGFGYDPLFYLPDEGATFGELRPEAKNRISHRARAVWAAAQVLRGEAEASGHG
jgi:XTP/dITP diphosphohydrolase